VSAAGDVRLTRRYYACRHCGQTATPLDEWAGLEKGHLTIGAQQMAALAATGWSFDQASANLFHLCGVRISDQTIRRAALREGVKVQRWQRQAPEAIAHLQQAAGVREFLADGAMVNTREGWRELRLSIFSKRPPGEPRDPTSFTGLENRHLPKPTATVVLARQAGSERQGDLWQETSERLGWGDGLGVSVIADGAAWIAAQVQRVFPRAQRVVDVYHVSGHLHDCGEALHPKDHDAARPWARDRLTELVQHGPEVLLWTLDQQRSRSAEPEQEAALAALMDYLQPHIEAMPYGQRLKGGLPIGSGQVEGACKTIIGRRLKLNSARWKSNHTEPMAALCSLIHTNQWDTYWSNRAA
jgi:hypothetical protein